MNKKNARTQISNLSSTLRKLTKEELAYSAGVSSGGGLFETISPMIGGGCTTNHATGTYTENQCVEDVFKDSD